MNHRGPGHPTARGSLWVANIGTGKSTGWLSVDAHAALNGRAARFSVHPAISGGRSHGEARAGLSHVLLNRGVAAPADMKRWRLQHAAQSAASPALRLAETAQRGTREQDR